MDDVDIGQQCTATNVELLTGTYQYQWSPNNDITHDFCFNKNPRIIWRLKNIHKEFSKLSVSYLSFSLHSSDQLDFSCILGGWVLNEKSEKVASIPKTCRLFTELNQKFELHLQSCKKHMIKKKINFLLDVQLIFDNKPNERSKESAISPPVSLKKDLGRLLEEDSGDVTFLAGDKMVSVHRTIVMARSPVLAAILNEAGDQHHFQDWDVVQSVVRYMYTDHIEDLETNARKLYPVAWDLALFSLIELCEEAIEKSLTFQNAAETLVLVSGLSKDLKARVINFVKDNLEKVKPTAGFKCLVSTHPNLFLELSCLVLNVDATPGS